MPKTREAVSERRRQGLLEWFDDVKRPLPWREDIDPYRVWLSETMLQQTRVETAVPYYQKFLRVFPDVGELARADAVAVRALWSGLGYYRRAAMLQEAARLIVAEGDFPKTARDWRRLPGVGPYTAAAVASISFGEKVAALDGNVERVMTRLEAYGDSPKTAAARRFLTGIAESWLDDKRPGDSNQALMELGATVCLPKQPRCSRCPIRRNCRARAEGSVEAYPFRPRKPAPREHRLIALCVKQGERFLLFRRRSQEELLAGTWETPWFESDQANPERLLARTYGGVWALGERVAKVRHTITNRKLEVLVCRATLESTGSIAAGRESRWVSPDELAALPHSSLVRKVLVAFAQAPPEGGVGSMSPPARRNQPTSLS